MISEPSQKQAVVFIDGQSLFRSAKTAFGYHFPNYDVKALAEIVCNLHGWTLKQVRFYTGVPGAREDSRKHQFWSAKLNAMRLRDIVTYSRPVRYQNQEYDCPTTGTQVVKVGVEKGIDVRIAIDMIRMAHHKDYDVAVIFSQDQDFSEVADEVRDISTEQQRWIKIASAFPMSESVTNTRGVNHTDWIQIDKTTYDSCIDLRNYQPVGAHTKP